MHIRLSRLRNRNVYYFLLSKICEWRQTFPVSMFPPRKPFVGRARSMRPLCILCVKYRWRPLAPRVHGRGGSGRGLGWSFCHPYNPFCSVFLSLFVSLFHFLSLSPFSITYIIVTSPSCARSRLMPVYLSHHHKHVLLSRHLLAAFALAVIVNQTRKRRRFHPEFFPSAMCIACTWIKLTDERNRRYRRWRIKNCWSPSAGIAKAPRSWRNQAIRISYRVKWNIDLVLSTLPHFMYLIKFNVYSLSLSHPRLRTPSPGWLQSNSLFVFCITRTQKASFPCVYTYVFVLNSISVLQRKSSYAVPEYNTTVVLLAQFYKLDMSARHSFIEIYHSCSCVIWLLRFALLRWFVWFLNL